GRPRGRALGAGGGGGEGGHRGDRPGDGGPRGPAGALAAVPTRAAGSARSPLSSWIADRAARARLRRRLGGRPLVLPPLDRRWRGVAPDWAGCLALARAGAPFHAVAERRYDRSGAPRAPDGALATGATVYPPPLPHSLP